ncbi:MAG: DNA starvation/stationary phase protection protein Dps [Gemmataceae bacterium]
MADDKYRAKDKTVNPTNGKGIPGHSEVSQQPRLHSTRNDLPEKVRSNVVALLNSRLADCIDLQTQTKQAHWNVKGSNFIALHKLFDEIHEDVACYSDTIAERVVQLGGTAAGTARVVATRSSLAEYPPTAASGHDHAAALADALGALGGLAREAMFDANEIGDVVTADVLTEVSRGLDKWLWMVEAHLPEPERPAADGRRTSATESTS